MLMLKQNPQVGLTQMKLLQRDLCCKTKQQGLLRCTGADQTLSFGVLNCCLGLEWGLDQEGTNNNSNNKKGQEGKEEIVTWATGSDRKGNSRQSQVDHPTERVQEAALNYFASIKIIKTIVCPR